MAINSNKENDMKRKQQAVTLNLAECKRLYEDHFKKDLPGNLPYLHAAIQVRDEIGIDEFLKRLDAIR